MRILNLYKTNDSIRHTTRPKPREKEEDGSKERCDAQTRYSPNRIVKSKRQKRLMLNAPLRNQ